MQNSQHSKTCGFAWPGTYGHECGAPATQIVVLESKLTTTGLYYGGRCDAHVGIKGGDNAGFVRVEPINGQVNEWNGRYTNA